jgi:hypothetical protein
MTPNITRKQFLASAGALAVAVPAVWRSDRTYAQGAATQARPSGYAFASHSGCGDEVLRTGRRQDRRRDPHSGVFRRPARQRAQHRVRHADWHRRHGVPHHRVSGIVLSARPGPRSAVPVPRRQGRRNPAGRPHRRGTPRRHARKGHLRSRMGPLRLAPRPRPQAKPSANPPISRA